MESKSEYQFQGMYAWGKYGTFFPKNYKNALNVELLLSTISISRENMKNLHEIMQSFRFSNVCFWSYLTRTILEIILRYFIIVQIISQLSKLFHNCQNISQLSKLSHNCQNYPIYLLSIGLFLIYWCWGMPNLKTDIDCNVHGIRWRIKLQCNAYLGSGERGGT